MTQTRALTARNLDGISWVENGQRAVLQAGYRYFGVTDGAGRWLSFDGVAPYALARKSSATEVAETIVIDDQTRWITQIG